MGFADDFRQLLLKIQEEEGSQLRAAQKLGVSNGAFSSWLSGARGKGHTALFTALDRAGARLVFPGQNLSSEDGGADLAGENARLRKDLERRERLLLFQSGRIAELREQLSRRKGKDGGKKTQVEKARRLMNQKRPRRRARQRGFSFCPGTAGRI